MNQADRKEWLERLLCATQKTRSIWFETHDASNTRSESYAIAERLGEEDEPWLFGEGCILKHIVKAIENGSQPIDVFNFSIIARESAMLHVGGTFLGLRELSTQEIWTLH